MRPTYQVAANRGKAMWILSALILRFKHQSDLTL
jgi:hypothetical protein